MKFAKFSDIDMGRIARAMESPPLRINLWESTGLARLDIPTSRSIHPADDDPATTCIFLAMEVDWRHPCPARIEAWSGTALILHEDLCKQDRIDAFRRAPVILWGIV